MKLELFMFSESGDPIVLTPLTSHSESVSWQGFNFCPELISRGEIRLLPDTTRGTLVVSMSTKSDLARRWLADSSDNLMSLTLWTKVGANDPDVVWSGTLIQAEASGSIIRGTFITSAGALQQVGVRRRYQRTCPYDLYGPQCKVDEGAFSTIGTVISESADGITVVVTEAASEADGFYTGGIIQNATLRKRYIVKHVGDTLTLSKKLGGLGGTVTLMAGCNKTTADCQDTFNNLDNYGGFPYMPLKNPFEFISIV